MVNYFGNVVLFMNAGGYLKQHVRWLKKSWKKGVTWFEGDS